METIHSVAHLILQNYYMLKIDLKDACYSVKILEKHSKYIKFFAGSKLLKFFVLPNGLSSGLRKFTKLTKPPLAVLRLEGIVIAIYIDDLIILGETYEECLTGSIKTIKMLLRLGFLIHPDKSTFFATQKLTYLGFIFDSVNMLLSVTNDKKDKIQKLCNSYLQKESLRIRELVSLIGTLTATFPGNKLGPLYYRALDKCKTYVCRVTLSRDAVLDLE